MTIQTATISVVGSFATKSAIIWAIFCNNWNDFLINTYISSDFPICIDSKAIRPQGILRIELRQTVYGLFDLSFELEKFI